MTKSVFISHASEDSEIALKVCEVLERKQVTCWLAPRDIRPGQDYASEIIHGLQGSRAVLLLLSPAANESKFVKREIERAVSMGLPVLPMRLKDIEPSQALELFISGTHWLDVWTPPIDQYVDRLIAGIDALSNKAVPVEPEPAPTPPKEKSKKAGSGLKSILALLLILAVAGGWFAFRNPSKSQTDHPRETNIEKSGEKISTTEESGADRDTDGTETASKVAQVDTETLPGTGRADFSKVHEAVAPEPEIAAEADISSLLKPLSNVRNEERSKRLHQIEDQIPDKLSAKQVSKLIEAYGNNDEERYLRELKWLRERLPKKLEAADLETLLRPLQNADRSKAITLLWERFPTRLEPKEFTSISRHYGNDDTRRYLDELTRQTPKLPEKLEVESVKLVLQPLNNEERSKGIDLLLSRIPKSISVKDFEGIVKRYGTKDEARWISELERFFDRLPETLSGKDVIDLVRPLSEKPRYETILVLCPRVGQLTSRQLHTLTTSYLGNSAQSKAWGTEIHGLLSNKVRDEK